MHAHDEPGDRSIHVTVAYSPCERQVELRELRLAPGSSVADALRESGLAVAHGWTDPSSLSLGVWGTLCEPTQTLRDRDRVEVYRALKVDPKEARRRRQQQQRARQTAAKAARRG